MDEHDTTPHPHDLPHPPPVSRGAEDTLPPRSARPHLRRGLIATVAATALVAVGGLGVGYAVGHGHRAGAASAVQGTTQTPQQTWATPDPYGHWDGGDSSGGQFFGGQLGGQGSSRSGSAGTDTSGDTTTKASGSQLTGLVRIVSTMKYSGGMGAGTGMILTSDGEVVTNHHVVEGSTSVKVAVMATGATYTAKVVGTDAADDVAVLQLDGAHGLSTITPDTDGVSVNEPVTAVGDGNGTVSYLSAATGSVTATGQQIRTQAEGSAAGESLRNLIEISSDVVPGFSGGATYDADGQVVGMTTAASGDTSGTGDTTGYAVPIDTVLTVAQDLGAGVSSAGYHYGYPAFLGIGLGQGTSTTVQGTYDGTPAASAGLAAGDTITSVDGTATQTAARLRSVIATHQPGDSVRVTWTSADGSSHSAAIELAQGPVA